MNTYKKSNEYKSLIYEFLENEVVRWSVKKEFVQIGCF